MQPHKHDQEWIRQQIRSLPFHLQEFAKKKYQEVFEEEWQAEPVDHLKMSKARREANTRLRKYVEKLINEKSGGDKL